MDDRQLRRAGLDYHEFADIRVHDNLQALFAALPGGRCFAFTTRASVEHTAATFAHGDILLFGPETRGLPTEVLESLPAGQRLRIPMRANVRSLNLSNSVAIAVYEAWRQWGFSGANE